VPSRPHLAPQHGDERDALGWIPACGRRGRQRRTFGAPGVARPRSGDRSRRRRRAVPASALAPQLDLLRRLAIGHLAIASTAIAFVLWDRALARLGPERTGLFAGPMPVSAALAGAAVTTGPPRPGTLMGTIVTGTGLAVGLGSGRSREGTVR
jgi:hypothetical protein